jgi:predicted nucleic-acid-binding Zn-ribbon protein
MSIGLIIVFCVIVLFLLTTIKFKEIKAKCDKCKYVEKINLQMYIKPSTGDKIEYDFSPLLYKKCPMCGNTMINEKDLKILNRIKNKYDPNYEGNGIKFKKSTKKHIDKR